MDDEPHLLKRNATEADLELVPDHLTGEIIDGKLYAFPRPGSLHGLGITKLVSQLERGDDDREPRGWVFIIEPAAWFGKRKRQMFVPDIAGWRRAKMPEVPDVKSFKLAPDWVCEGLSPSTARYDRGRKREVYAACKVGHLWFFDPRGRYVEVFELIGERYQLVTTAAGSDLTRLAPFDFKIDLAKLLRR